MHSFNRPLQAKRKMSNNLKGRHKDMGGDVPCLRLHPYDITAIDQAIKGYLAYLRGGVPPSSTRDTRIKRLQNLRLRLANVPQGEATDATLPLTVADIQALQAALEGFVRLVRRMVPCSQERDETLYLLEVLCQQLAAMLSPHLHTC